MPTPNPATTKWYYRWPWTRVLMFFYCLLCTFVGVIGLAERPSAAIQNVWGYYAVLLYSTILVISGAIGAAGIFRSLRATVVSVWAIAAATFFHGIATWANGGAQTGLRLMIAPLMMVPLVWVWSQWLMIVRNVSRLRWPPWKSPHEE